MEKNVPTLNEAPKATRCKCAAPKPFMYPDGVILWCDGCWKILAIPVYLRTQWVTGTTVT